MCREQNRTEAAEICVSQGTSSSPYPRRWEHEQGLQQGTAAGAGQTLWKQWVLNYKNQNTLSTRLSPYETSKCRCGSRTAIPNPLDSRYSGNFSYCWVSKTGWGPEVCQPCAQELRSLLGPTAVKGQESLCFAIPNSPAYWDSLQQADFAVSPRDTYTSDIVPGPVLFPEFTGPLSSQNPFREPSKAPQCWVPRKKWLCRQPKL